MKEIASKIGIRIRFFRHMREWSQEKLALEAGINPAFLGHIERGLKSPTIDTLYKISSALGITISELVKIEEPVSENSSVEKITLLLKTLSEKDASIIAHIVSEILKINKN